MIDWSGNRNRIFFLFHSSSTGLHLTWDHQSKWSSHMNLTLNLNHLFPPHLLLDLGLLETWVCDRCWAEPFTCNIFIYLNQLPPEFTCAHFYVTYCLLMQLYLYSEGVWSRLNLPHLVSCSFSDSFINPDRGVLLCGYVELGREACFPTHTRQRIILC